MLAYYALATRSCSLSEIILLTCLRFLCFGLAADKLEDSRAFSDQAGGDA
jgi:hypothetical protein